MNSNNWISNLLPAPKNEDQKEKAESLTTESVSSQQTSKEVSPASTPVHQIHQNEAASNLMHQSPQKPVNLLPEVPEMSSSSGRKLSDREKRDCEVIGNFLREIIFVPFLMFFVYDFRTIDQVVLLHRSQEHPG